MLKSKMPFWISTSLLFHGLIYAVGYWAPKSKETIKFNIEISKSMSKKRSKSMTSSVSLVSFSKKKRKKMLRIKEKKVLQEETVNRFNSNTVGRINKEIQNTIRYPLLAVRMGWTGDVIVAITVLPTGKVKEVNIVKSSNHYLLDNTAVKAVKGWTFPKGEKIETIKLAFSFQLTS